MNPMQIVEYRLRHNAPSFNGSGRVSDDGSVSTKIVILHSRGQFPMSSLLPISRLICKPCGLENAGQDLISRLPRISRSSSPDPPKLKLYSGCPRGFASWGISFVRGSAKAWFDKRLYVNFGVRAVAGPNASPARLPTGKIVSLATTQGVSQDGGAPRPRCVRIGHPGGA